VGGYEWSEWSVWVVFGMRVGFYVESILYGDLVIIVRFNNIFSNKFVNYKNLWY
jgi:hypothetical protein